MRKILTQILLIVVVAVVCSTIVSWIRAQRPEDAPFERGESLRTPVSWVELEVTAAELLIHELPGNAEPWRRVTLSAEVGGQVHFAQAELEPGVRIRSGAPVPTGIPRPGSPHSRPETGRDPEESGLEGAVPISQGPDSPEPQEALPADALATIDLPTHRLERQLAERRLEQARIALQGRLTDITQLTQTLTLAQKNLELHQRRLARLEGRLGTGAGAVSVADQDVDEAALQVGAAMGRVVDARAGLDRARQAKGSTELAVQLAEREKTLAQRREDQAIVRSPVDGYLMRRVAEDGTSVLPGAALLEIAVLSPLRVKVRVPTEVYALFSRETRAWVIFPAFAPGDSATDEGRWKGALEARPGPSEPLADVANRSVLVEFLVENPPGRLAVQKLDGRLPAGIACEVRIGLRTVRDELWLLDRWIVGTDEGPCVYRLRDLEGRNAIAERVPVRLGFSRAGRSLLVHSPLDEMAERGTRALPLRPGDRLATTNLDVLVSGDAVRLHDAGLER